MLRISSERGLQQGGDAVQLRGLEEAVVAARHAQAAQAAGGVGAPAPVAAVGIRVAGELGHLALAGLQHQQRCVQADGAGAVALAGADRGAEHGMHGLQGAGVQVAGQALAVQQREGGREGQVLRLDLRQHVGGQRCLQVLQEPLQQLARARRLRLAGHRRRGIQQGQAGDLLALGLQLAGHLEGDGAARRPAAQAVGALGLVLAQGREVVGGQRRHLVQRRTVIGEARRLEGMEVAGHALGQLAVAQHMAAGRMNEVPARLLAAALLQADQGA